MNLYRHMLALLLLSATIGRAEEFTLYGENGVGPIVMNTRIEMLGKTAAFAGTAQNQSGVPIRRAVWCVRATKKPKSGCAFTLFTTTTRWDPGDTISLEFKAPAVRGFPRHFVSLTELQPVTKFDPIQRIVVESIQGTSGNLAREQLIALILNSGRFQVVQDRSTADATLSGIAEPRGQETKVVSAGTSSGVSINSANAAATTSATSGVFGSGAAATTSGTGRVFGRSVGRSATDSQTLGLDVVVLKLTLPTGEIIWAWDDTRPCDQSHTKCAIDDLTAAAQD
jgi:hypothetical protein